MRDGAMVAREIHTLEVEGSIPSPATKFKEAGMPTTPFLQKGP